MSIYAQLGQQNLSGLAGASLDSLKAQAQMNAPQVVYGVQSSIKRLQEQSVAVLQLAEAIRQSIGISVPESGKPVSSGNTLADAIDSASSTLRDATQALEFALQHLNG